MRRHGAMRARPLLAVQTAQVRPSQTKDRPRSAPAAAVRLPVAAPLTQPANAEAVVEAMRLDARQEAVFAQVRLCSVAPPVILWAQTESHTP